MCSDLTLTYKVIRTNSDDAWVPSTMPGALGRVGLVFSKREKEKGNSWQGKKDVQMDRCQEFGGVAGTWHLKCSPSPAALAAPGGLSRTQTPKALPETCGISVCILTRFPR